MWSEPSSIALVGLGVVGGSLARGLRAAGYRGSIRGWAPDADDLAAAVAEAGATPTAGPEDAVRGAEVVVLAAPLDAVVHLTRTLAPVLPARAVLTDVASLKVPVREAAAACGLGGRWVGSHPMAGSEGSGFAASRADLFHDARVWIVADAADPAAAARVEGMWERVGARPARVGAAVHDRRMASASHLPQLLANALAERMAARGLDPTQLGPGGRDMTRLAASRWSMWRDLLRHAAPELAEDLRGVAERLRDMAESLDAGDVEDIGRLMERTRSWREES